MSGYDPWGLLDADMLGARLPAHLYVHVPFCASKCAYCDFVSYAGADESAVEAVFRGIRSQLSGWASTGLDGVLETIYVGGGTPSMVSGEVVSLLAFIRRAFVVHPAAEITVEANPDSLTPQVARALAGAGVTRVSVGVQSFDDVILRVLGRRHDAAGALRACQSVMDEGMQLSVDLMCGIPGQSITSWSETLQRAAATGAHHASVYPLTIEDGTPLQVGISAGLLGEPDADAAADMMVLAKESMGYHGLARYEVANYAESARYESVHNTAYWTGRSYIGVGPGAFGMLDSATAVAAGMVPQDASTEGGVPAARVRYGNAGVIDEWLVGRGDSFELLDAEESAREDVMLGMRLTRGVRADSVEAAGLTGVLESLAADGLVERHGAEVGGRWRTTDRGWLLGNQVFGRIWSGE